MTRFDLGVGISITDPASLASEVLSWPMFAAPPTRLEYDDVLEPTPIAAGWQRQFISFQGKQAWAKWDGRDADHWHHVILRAQQRASQVLIADAFSSVEEALALLLRMPGDLFSLGTFYIPEWRKLDRDIVGFGTRHIPHGWGCAFRGAGHDRLSSRRWLDFGPWRVLRGPGDFSFVQFHDLQADAELALKQAAPGHERMGISKTGGFLQMPYPFVKDVGGLYQAGTRTLEIVVPPGGKVEQVRMRDVCAVRHMHRIDPPATKPIDHVAYVFLDEADARAHLHELWLRELECWVADGAGKRRLDLDHDPKPEPPEWVRALETDR